MLFNSTQFFLFFIAIYAVYLAFQFNYRWQNFFLLIGSYFFYGFWDYRFLVLIWITTTVDYVASIYIEKAQEQGKPRIAKAWLATSVVLSLVLLGFFKYYNFFADNLVGLFSIFGLHLSPFTLHIILPAGMSFYTFQTMSYVIDVYRREQPATRNYFDFALFVSFFPQLIAGPIERARDLLSQLQRPRTITAQGIHDGLWLIVWGLFQKIFIADNLAPYVNWNFTLKNAHTAPEVYLGLITFTIMIYCDFSGYSDMARGMGKWFGVELSYNFRLPFLAKNPAELWNRWHITLSRWFRDYVYKPLRAKGIGHATAVFVTMFLVGLWHGADWAYVIWGSLWGVALIAQRYCHPLMIRLFPKRNPAARRFSDVFGVIFMIHLWLVIGMFFVAANLPKALYFLSILFSQFSIPPEFGRDVATVLYFSWPLIAVQTLQSATRDLAIMKRLPFALETSVYALLLCMLLVNGAALDKKFIYFQF